MIQESFKLEGLDELLKNLKQYEGNFDKEVAILVKKTALSIKTRAIKKIQRGPKTGRIYKKYLLNRDHQASAPGEPPATDEGKLVERIEANISGASAEVGTNEDYGAYLEFGTVHIKPRPWLFPSMEEEKPAWGKGLKTINDKAVK